MDLLSNLEWLYRQDLTKFTGINCRFKVELPKNSMHQGIASEDFASIKLKNRHESPRGAQGLEIRFLAASKIRFSLSVRL